MDNEHGIITMESTADFARRFIAQAGWWFPPTPKTDSQRQAALVADIEGVLERHGHEAHARELAMLAVTAVRDACDEMERTEQS